MRSFRPFTFPFLPARQKDEDHAATPPNEIFVFAGFVCLVVNAWISIWINAPPA
jgi:hypothetical protein